MRRSRVRVGSCAAVIALLLAGLVSGQPTKAGAGRAPAAPAQRPNIVYVLTDDLSWDLVQYLPQVRKMQAEGMTFTEYVATDSLCCPSRASTFTGRFPHNTGVFTNAGPDGGFAAFHDNEQESDTFATGLHARGYRTAMMGKYLNGYQPGRLRSGTDTYVPPGWSTWNVSGGGYAGYWYNITDDHAVVTHGGKPADYITDVLAEKGADFIERSAPSRKPFFLEVATYAPHSPYTPAPRHATEFAGLTAPRVPAYDALPTDPPPWLANRPRLNAQQRANIDRAFRMRAQSVQAVDDLIARLRSELVAAGEADNTYLVFGSDNGFHLGERRLTQGKATAFDSDVRVPLVVAGPGVPAGTKSDAAVANIDIAPTFLDLGRARIPSTVDGRSMLPLLRGGSDADWRTANLVEHHGPVTRPDDPDRPAPGSGNPATYSAMRTKEYTYVEYEDGFREYYDRIHDPDQLHNLAGRLTPLQESLLHDALTRLVQCRGPSCWKAGHI